MSPHFPVIVSETAIPDLDINVAQMVCRAIGIKKAALERAASKDGKLMFLSGYC